ncbi:glycosyltransferase family 2 protein [Rubripirellula lacrimiformis]|nr:glycosyltransferase family 2 protein [Rubripirellula lacrimiformis]
MNPNTKLSIVLPVRNGQDRIAERIERVLMALVEFRIEGAEIVVVDDGSSDATPMILADLCIRYPRVRVMRHNRPRGMEAAGQTGLERAVGDLVFIQESDAELRLEDLQRLLQISEDPTIVAARAESCSRPLSPELTRRLRAAGTNADHQFEYRVDDPHRFSLQMIRRTHLQSLSGPGGGRYRLVGQHSQSTRLESA